MHVISTTKASEQRKRKYFAKEMRLEKLHFFEESRPFSVKQFKNRTSKYGNKPCFKYLMNFWKCGGEQNRMGCPKNQVCKYLHHFRHFVCSKLPSVVSQLHLALWNGAKRPNWTNGGSRLNSNRCCGRTTHPHSAQRCKCMHINNIFAPGVSPRHVLD